MGVKVIVIGVDPGHRSTGVAVYDDHGGAGVSWTASQYPLPEAMRALAAFASSAHGPIVVGVERPYTEARGMGKASALSLWRLGEAYGRCCALSERVGVIYTPTAIDVRRILGISKGRRRQVNEMVWQWATATTGIPLLGPRGAKMLDAANAVATAVAAMTLTKKGA